MGGALHNEEAAMFQKDPGGCGQTLVFEAELAFCSEAEGSDDAVPAEGFFVMAVPAHAFAAVVIEIEEAGVQADVAELLDEDFEFQQFRSPRESLLGGAGVAVGKPPVAIPDHLAGGDVMFAQDDHFVIFHGTWWSRAS